MDSTTNNHIKGVVEALLFISEKPVTLEQIREVLETVNGAEIKDVIKNLQDEYQQRDSGMVIVEIAGGYQMLSSPNHAMAIRSFLKTRHKEKLSKPALETLAIVAYKQPISRIDIELIRGVNCDGVVAHLLAKSLIKIVGRKEVPGRPFIYGTTKEFLEYFGLRSLNDLPKLEDITLLEPPAEVTQPEEQTSSKNAVSQQDSFQEKQEIAIAKKESESVKISPEEKVKKEVETFIEDVKEFSSPEAIEDHLSGSLEEESGPVRLKKSDAAEEDSEIEDAIPPRSSAVKVENL